MVAMFAGANTVGRDKEFSLRLGIPACSSQLNDILAVMVPSHPIKKIRNLKWVPQ